MLLVVVSGDVASVYRVCRTWFVSLMRLDGFRYMSGVSDALSSEAGNNRMVQKTLPKGQAVMREGLV